MVLQSTLIEDLNKKKRLFFHIYDLKSEEIPSEEEWALRMKEVFHKEHKEPYKEPLCMKP